MIRTAVFTRFRLIRLAVLVDRPHVCGQPMAVQTTTHHAPSDAGPEKARCLPQFDGTHMVAEGFAPEWRHRRDEIVVHRLAFVVRTSTISGVTQIVPDRGIESSRRNHAALFVVGRSDSTGHAL